MMKHSIKGLYCFIDEIRNCKCLEDEEKTVLQEIIKIKKKFNEKNISNYKRKKYIWKLIYCHILGYGISLSYLDIIKLMSSSNFSDKYCGYTALSLLVNENNEMLHMMISTIKLDLKSNDEKVNFLALHFASQKINDLLIENMYEDILHIVTSNYIYKPNIRKKAFLCLANIYKKRHDLLLKNKTELEIFKFLDQNLNEVNMFNVFAYLNLIYVIILVFQKYETMQHYRMKEEKRKKKYFEEKDHGGVNDDEEDDDEEDEDEEDEDEEDEDEDEDDEDDDNNNSNIIGGGNRRDEHSIKREDLKADSSNHGSRRIISLNIKDEVKRKRYHKLSSSSLSNEQSFLYNDLKKVDKIMEIDSQCSFNMDEINFVEVKKYINKYIHFILNVLYLILDENLKIDEGFYYSQFRYPFLLIKCLQMVQLYDLHGLSQNTINNINDILYRIVNKSFKKLQGKVDFETGKTKNGRHVGHHLGHHLSNTHSGAGAGSGNGNRYNDKYGHDSSNVGRRNIFRKSFSKNSFYIGMKKSKEELRNEKSTTYIEYAIIYECCSVQNFLGNKIEDRNRDIILCLITNSFDSKKSNINYVILNSLAKLKMNIKIYSMLENHIMHLINLLNNDDITIKLQTFNILFNMCNNSNWKLLINVFLHHLPYIDPYIQNEVIIKISILAENFSPDLSWYIDVIFKIIEITYRSIFPEVWFRLVQIVTGFVEGEKQAKGGDKQAKGGDKLDKGGDKLDKGDSREKGDSRDKATKSVKKESTSVDNSKLKEEQKVQTYAAMKCYKYLSDRYTKIELLIDLCSYIIGSFGYLIKDKVPMSTQLKILEMYFTLGSSNTKCVILMAIMKMVSYDSKLMSAVKKILSTCITHADLELQTRACEFLNLCNLNNTSVLNYLLKGMPLYHTKKVHENFLIKRLLEKNKHAVIDFNEKDSSLKFGKCQEKAKSGRRHEQNYKDDKDNESASGSGSGSDYSRNKGSSCTSSDGSYNVKVRRKVSNGSVASSGNSKKSSSTLSTHKTKNSSDHTDDNAKLFKSLSLQKANNINDLWFNACLLDKSLFFKNSVLSILIKQKYQENKAIFTFYVKNISKTMINLASIRIEECEQMHIKEAKIAMNEKIDPDGVYVHKIIITILDIFYNIPSIYFNVLTPNSANASLSSKLPILITRFIKENKMNEATFKIYWKALTQVHNEDIVMGIPKFSKKYFFNYLINAFNFYILKIGSLICASGYIHFPVTDSENKILILVKIRHEMKGCQISVVSSIKHLNNYLNKIFEIYLIKNK